MADFLWSLGAFVLVLSPLVFFHELGHYLMAKFFGVHVDSFSIGFGPQLIGWTDRSGTRWKISLFLLGGYVKMAGDENIASSISCPSSAGHTLADKTPFQRILVALSGPLTNYLVAFILLMGLMTNVGELTYPPIVGKVVENSPAARAGIVQGDSITAIGKGPESKVRVTQFKDILKILQEIPASSPLILEKHPLNPKLGLPVGGDVVLSPVSLEGSWLGKVGISPDIKLREYKPVSFSEALSSTLSALNPLKMVKGLKIENMGGPVSIAQQAGSVIHEGIIPILYFMAMISVALGFFNLLPIPLLDGGMVILSVIEMILRRPLSSRTQHIVSTISFMILGSLFLFLFWKDLQRIPLVHQLMQSLSKLF